MGTLRYGGHAIPMNDRTLLHVQIIVGAKLRHGESTFLSWRPKTGETRRSSIWVSPGIPMAFLFDGSHLGSVNRAWLEAMSASGSTGVDLQIMEEVELQGHLQPA
ncbi:hypothetical protein EDF46_3510 [Frondihabitans sp. PhB188]|uniref:DUF7882 family protein n=1 Tax=Frondihabitans sp. PhB188 TaxID=2485200 RepID=UPI000F48F1DA|nr:hypothetical protein [Frondihabitans sp. PhB188]ROQ30998.1 hypothetical protein EDF46_3510 [Frondihabitans sp. PhB188]